jgi:hypothetical protein
VTATSFNGRAVTPVAVLAKGPDTAPVPTDAAYATVDG